MIGKVRRFVYGGPEEAVNVQPQLHSGQDVLVLRLAGSQLFIVEALDGAEFGAFVDELAGSGTTPAAQFPSNG